MKSKENDLKTLTIRLEINFHKLTQSKQAQVIIKKVRKSLFIQGGTSTFICLLDQEKLE